MNNNLFKIDSEEIKRILTLHEERSKKQYLNIISEQEKTNQITLSSDIRLKPVKPGEYELKLFKGTVFQKIGKDLIATTKYNYVHDITGGVMAGPSSGLLDTIVPEGTPAKKGKILFSCANGKFIPQNSPTNAYYDKQKTFAVRLTQLCGNSIGKFTQKQSGNKTVRNDKNLNFKMGSNNLSIRPNSVITNNNGIVTTDTVVSNNYKIEFSCPNTFNAIPTFQNGSPSKCFPSDNYTLKFFQTNFCSTKQKQKSQQPVGQKPVDPKLEKAQKCGHKSWEEYKASNWKCTPTQQLTVDPTQANLTPVQQDFVNKTSTSINNLQSLLGITPTGKLDSSQVQTLIDKLNTK